MLQARQFGFDERAYLAALDRVPVFTRAATENILGYNVALASFVDETPTLAELLGRLRHLVGSRAEIVAVPSERLRAAGLDPGKISPFSGRWMSFLDPGRAHRELGFRHEPLEIYLGKIVASFLAHPPSDRPEGYARRDAERAVAAAR